MQMKPLLSTIVRMSIILFSIVLLYTTQSAMAASLSLRWDPNNPAPQGYRVFARKSNQAYNYNKPNWQGRATQCTISALADRTDYYFVVRAYDGNRVSTDSKEVHYSSATNGGNGSGVGKTLPAPVVLYATSEAPVEHIPILDDESTSGTAGDSHHATQWQIFDTNSEDCLFDAATDRRLTDLKVPLLLLKGDTQYYWRARFLDRGGNASSWSSKNYFTTDAAENDLDGNGIPDDWEGANWTAEGFHALSSSAASGCVPTGISVASEDTISAIEQVLLVDPVTFDMDENTPDQLPIEMVAYKLFLNQPGQKARIRIHLSQPAPAGATWFKYDEINGWQDYSDYAEFSADRRSVTIEVEDGGYGDADGVANGIIIDPVGLAVVDGSSSGAAAGGGGGGGGCFIGTIRNTPSDDNAARVGPWQRIKFNLLRLLNVEI